MMVFGGFDGFGQVSEIASDFLLCLLSRKPLWIFSSTLPGNFALKNGGIFWWIFPGLRFPQNEARKLLKNFGENSEQNSGRKF